MIHKHTLKRWLGIEQMNYSQLLLTLRQSSHLLDRERAVSETLEFLLTETRILSSGRRQSGLSLQNDGYFRTYLQTKLLDCHGREKEQKARVHKAATHVLAKQKSIKRLRKHLSRQTLNNKGFSLL